MCVCVCVSAYERERVGLVDRILAVKMGKDSIGGVNFDIWVVE